MDKIVKKTPEFTYIYGLMDSHNKVVRYIGKANNIKRRLIEHKSAARKLKKRRYLQNWINSIWEKGWELEIVLIEKVKYEDWEKREVFLINEYKNKGFKLTNTSKGGEGGMGAQIKFTEPYVKVKEWAKKQNINSQSEWFKFINNHYTPDFIPKRPCDVYKNRGWENWGDFLGTGRKSGITMLKGYISYENAKKELKNKGVKTAKEWKCIKRNTQKFKNIPSNADRVYKNKGWEGWGTFLNSSNFHFKSKKYISYEEAKLKVIKEKIKSSPDWKMKNKEKSLFNDVPRNPYRFYKNSGWVSWGDFLGTGTIANQKKVFLSYKESSIWMKTNNPEIKTSNEFAKWRKGNRPTNIPFSPDEFYKNNEWISWKEFLS